MNEKNSSKNLGTIKALMVLVGLLAVAASYFLVYSKYVPKNDDLETEIEELDKRLEELERKDKNKEAVIKKTEENNVDRLEILDKFDGGLSYQAEIVDLQDYMDDYSTEVDILYVPNLTISAPVDVFTFADGNIGKAITYQYSSTGTYAKENETFDQLKEAIKYFDDYTGKRKVPSSIDFGYDYATNLATLSFSVTEYAVAGEGREQEEVVIPEYDKGKINVFVKNTIS